MNTSTPCWLISLLFFLSFSPISGTTPPANDLIENAEVIPIVGGEADFCDNPSLIDITVNITEATGADYPMAICSVPFESLPNGTEPGVWYLFTPTSSTAVEISTCNPATNFDTRITVFAGSIGNLVCIASNDDGFCSENTISTKVNFQSVALQPYYIYLYGYQGDVGIAQMTISCNNEDDLCLAGDNMDFISVGDTLIRDFTNDTDMGIPKSSCSPTPINSRGKWFRFLSPDTALVEISTCYAATNFDTKIKIYSEELGEMVYGPCGDPLCIAENDNACGGLKASVSFQANKCDNYYIFIYGLEGNLGTAQITLTMPPSNDLCQQAQHILINKTIIGNTSFASDQDAPPLCNNLSANPGVWYTFIGNGEKLELSTCASCFANIIQYSPGNCAPDPPNVCSDTRISLFEGDCNGPLTCIALNDDACLERSRLNFCSSPGTTYFVYVDNPNASRGFFQLELKIDPSPDLIINWPEDITVFVEPGETGAIVEYELPEAVPNCPDGTIPGVIEIIEVSVLGSGSFFPIGETIEVYQVVQVLAGGFSNAESSPFSITVLKRPIIPTLTQWGKVLMVLMIINLIFITLWNLGWKHK